jgi:flagellar hook-associated protein 1 FlgK
MSVLNTIRIGQTGLSAASAGIEVVGHNVANANTEGYHTRTLGTSASSTVNQGSMYFGQGTSIAQVSRAGDEIISSQLVESEGETAFQSSLYETLSVVETMFSETDESGLATALSEFFDSLEAATIDPSDSALRADVLYAAEDLASSVGSTWAFLDSSADGVKSQAEDSIASINEAVAQIAELQESISKDADSTGQGDLLDQRDALISELASSIGITVDYGENNEVTLYLGGHALVNDTAARTLSYDTDSDGNPVISISADGGSYEVTNEVGGALGGLLQSHEVIRSVQSDLDEFAQTFADAFNTQHAAGYDSSGAAGGAFFSYTSGSAASSMAVDTSLAADPGLLALASGATASAGDGGNLSAMVDLQDSEIFASGSQTAEEFVSGIYATIGQEVSAASAAYDSASATTDDLQTLYSSLTGVDLDQQAVELIQWQAAYQAAARVIAAGDEMLGELMEMAR